MRFYAVVFAMLLVISGCTSDQSGKSTDIAVKQAYVRGYNLGLSDGYKKGKATCKSCESGGTPTPRPTPPAPNYWSK